MRWAALSLVSVCACGRLSFDALGTPGGDGGNGDDAAAGSDGASACGAMSELSDTFTGPRRAVWEQAQDPGVGVAQTTGDLRITLVGGTASALYGGYHSACHYDFRTQVATVEMTSATNVNGGVEMYMLVENGGLSVGMEILDNLIYAHWFDDGGAGFMPIGMDAFNATADRFWRMGEVGGDMYFEISADNISYTQIATMPTPFDVSNITFVLGAGTFQSVAAPGVAGFDNLDIAF